MSAADAARGAFMALNHGLPGPTQPNQVWTVDFKGWFNLGNGERCDPLTVRDRYSRYVLGCEARANQQFKGTLHAFRGLIYAAVAVGYRSTAAMDQALAEEQFERLALPYAAGFLAGRAFVEYRRRGGVRQAPLPDFHIGAHAMVEGHTLLTRDPERSRTYFPKLRLICPE